MNAGPAGTTGGGAGARAGGGHDDGRPRREADADAAARLQALLAAPAVLAPARAQQPDARREAAVSAGAAAGGAIDAGSTGEPQTFDLSRSRISGRDEADPHDGKALLAANRGMADAMDRGVGTAGADPAATTPQPAALPSPMDLLGRLSAPPAPPAAAGAPLPHSPDWVQRLESLAVSLGADGRRRVRLSTTDALLADTVVELFEADGALQVRFFCGPGAARPALEAQAAGLAGTLAQRLGREVAIGVGGPQRDAADGVASVVARPDDGAPR